MSDNVDKLPSGVRVVDLTLVCHRPQLREGLHHSPHGVLGHIRAVLPQHPQLGLHAGIVDHVAGKQVAQGPEEVVAKEGEARPVGQHHHSEIWMSHDDVVLWFNVCISCKSKNRKVTVFGKMQNL